MAATSRPIHPIQAQLKQIEEKRRELERKIETCDSQLKSQLDAKTHISAIKEELKISPSAIPVAENKSEVKLEEGESWFDDAKLEGLINSHFTDYYAEIKIIEATVLSEKRKLDENKKRFSEFKEKTFGNDETKDKGIEDERENRKNSKEAAKKELDNQTNQLRTLLGNIATEFHQQQYVERGKAVHSGDTKKSNRSNTDLDAEFEEIFSLSTSNKIILKEFVVRESDHSYKFSPYSYQFVIDSTASLDDLVKFANLVLKNESKKFKKDQKPTPFSVKERIENWIKASSERELSGQSTPSSRGESKIPSTPATPPPTPKPSDAETPSSGGSATPVRRESKIPLTPVTPVTPPSTPRSSGAETPSSRTTTTPETQRFTFLRASPPPPFKTCSNAYFSLASISDTTGKKPHIFIGIQLTDKVKELQKSAVKDVKEIEEAVIAKTKYQEDLLVTSKNELEADKQRVSGVERTADSTIEKHKQYRKRVKDKLNILKQEFKLACDSISLTKEQITQLKQEQKNVIQAYSNLSPDKEAVTDKDLEEQTTALLSVEQKCKHFLEGEIKRCFSDLEGKIREHKNRIEFYGASSITNRIDSQCATLQTTLTKMKEEVTEVVNNLGRRKNAIDAELQRRKRQREEEQKRIEEIEDEKKNNPGAIIRKKAYLAQCRAYSDHLDRSIRLELANSMTPEEEKSFLDTLKNKHLNKIPEGNVHFADIIIGFYKDHDAAIHVTGEGVLLLIDEYAELLKARIRFLIIHPNSPALISFLTLAQSEVETSLAVDEMIIKKLEENDEEKQRLILEKLTEDSEYLTEDGRALQQKLQDVINEYIQYVKKDSLYISLTNRLQNFGLIKLRAVAGAEAMLQYKGHHLAAQGVKAFHRAVGLSTSPDVEKETFFKKIVSYPRLQEIDKTCGNIILFALAILTTLATLTGWFLFMLNPPRTVTGVTLLQKLKDINNKTQPSLVENPSVKRGNRRQSRPNLFVVTGDTTPTSSRPSTPKAVPVMSATEEKRHSGP